MSDARDSKRLKELAAMTEGLHPDEALAEDVLLAAAAEATREMDASPAFDSAVMAAVEVERLAQQTDDLAPDAALTDVVMSRIADAAPAEAEAPRSSSPWSGVVRSARAALVAAGAIAAGMVLYAGYVEVTFDSDVMANVDMVEVGDE